MGLTERFELKDIEMQGTVLGPIKASVQLDTLGRDCYERQEGLYLYNGCVSVPPLQMIDDVASFSICSTQSVVTNAIINAKIESKKLEFGAKKCYNIHIGNDKVCCQALKVHEADISQKDHETYLGDVICSSGSNNRNIQNRVNRGVGAVSEIISTLNQVSLGHYHFEMALIFRDSSLISKLVYSSEVWYNITNDQYKKLEEIDEMFMRKIFNLPRSAPRVSLYAECGKLPIRYIIKTRRLLYYWHILHLEEKELVYKFYLGQKLKPSRNDWILTVQKDMHEIGLQLTDREIKEMNQDKFRTIVKSKIYASASNYLSSKRGSKTAHLKFDIKPSDYLFSTELNVEEVQNLFKLRTRTIDVKDNQESSYKNNMWCRTCCLVKESQEHIFECHAIRKTLNYLNFQSYNYQMIFGKLEDQVKIAKLFQLVLNARDDIINNGTSPSPMEDPCTNSTVGLQQIVLSL